MRARRAENLTRQWAAIACFAIIGLCSNTLPASGAGWSDLKGARLDAVIESFLKRTDASDPAKPKASLALAIGTARRLYVARGFGESAAGVPADEHTIYHVGSLAKQFTAVAILDLIDRKAKLRDGTVLTRDLALAKIFRGVEHWPGADASHGQQPVTVQTLLTMTSNLPNFTRSPPASTNPWGRIGAPELLSEVKKLRPSGWPNTFEYSNTSYFLLAEILEEVIAPGEQMPRDQHAYLRQTIFPRAGLVETGFVSDYTSGSRVAQPIYRKPPVFDQPDWLKGSADVASSAADMYAWNRAFMAGRVIAPELAALMVSEGARVTPELYYGMGWFVEHRGRRDVYSHSGLVPGYTSYNLIAADGEGSLPSRDWISVTLLINTDDVEGLDALAETLLLLADE